MTLNERGPNTPLMQNVFQKNSSNFEKVVVREEAPGIPERECNIHEFPDMKTAIMSVAHFSGSSEDAVRDSWRKNKKHPGDDGVIWHLIHGEVE